MSKENKFVLITSVVFNEGNKEEYYKTYSGIVSYESDGNIGISKAVVHHVWKNHGTKTATSNSFSIDKKSIKSIEVLD